MPVLLSRYLNKQCCELSCSAALKALIRFVPSHLSSLSALSNFITPGRIFSGDKMVFHKSGQGGKYRCSARLLIHPTRQQQIFDLEVQHVEFRGFQEQNLTECLFKSLLKLSPERSFQTRATEGNSELRWQTRSTLCTGPFLLQLFEVISVVLGLASTFYGILLKKK